MSNYHIALKYVDFILFLDLSKHVLDMHLQGGALKLAPHLLHSYVVEGVPILVPHPVMQRICIKETIPH